MALSCRFQSVLTGSLIASVAGILAAPGVQAQEVIPPQSKIRLTLLLEQFRR